MPFREAERDSVSADQSQQLSYGGRSLVDWARPNSVFRNKIKVTRRHDWLPDPLDQLPSLSMAYQASSKHMG